jgi:hypothetical protein
MPQAPLSYWTPYGVVKTLRLYLHIKETLVSGLIAPGGESGGSGVYEPGPLLERLACKKADIDLGIRRLPCRQGIAVRCFFCDPGWQEYASVARIMRIQPSTASEAVETGVVKLCQYLCGGADRKHEALRALRDKPKEEQPDLDPDSVIGKNIVPEGKSHPPIRPLETPRYVIDERYLRHSATWRGRDDD